MSQDRTPPITLRFRPPFYSDSSLAAVGLDQLRNCGPERLSDDVMGNKLNMALRATIERQLEPDDLRR